MPSYLHELLLLLFRNRSQSAAELLRALDVQLPQFDTVSIDSSDLNDLRPTEYRADLVLFLVQGTEKVLGIVVEVQLGRDDDKRYAWPAYVANLRARYQCPACLLVITVEETVARWARKSIELGPGTRCTPWVVGPSNAPSITDVQEAEQNVELAVLSAIEHGNSANTTLASQVASAAILASATIDEHRFRLYLDLVLISLSERTRPEVLRTMKNSLGFEYQSDFVRGFVAQGLAEGQAKGMQKGLEEGMQKGLEEGMQKGLEEGRQKGRQQGRVELLLKLLAFRFGKVSETNQALIRRAGDAQLDLIAERILTAPTIEEVIESPSTG